MRITANKIDDWANTLDCRAKLPLLIRKLIYENINNLSKCKFPSLEQTTSSSGFDGILESNEKTQYVPKGLSVWEMGCDKDKKRKADVDYNKRKEDPLNTTPEETVYIQVSPRIWKDEKIKEWCDEKNQDDFWKDVILLDAKDLEEWINNTPSVEQWFAEELNFPNEGVETLNNWWEKWSSATPNIQFTSTLILTNKEKETEDLKYSLKNLKHIIVKSSTIEESIAFLYSVIDMFPVNEREFYLNKTLIIDNPKSFDFYSQYDLILIPTFEFVYNANTKSYVYIPISNEDPANANISLNDLIKFDLMNCLTNNMKIHPNLSRKYANECGGNISILRGILSLKSAQPSWFDENLIDILTTIFIVQSWDENNLNDIKIIENISGLAYEKFTRKLMILLNKPNTPLIKNQNIWILKFPPYLFFLIAPYLTKFDINNQYNEFLNIFKISNYINGFVKEKFSRNLKIGISKSIILIDIYGSNSNLKCKPIQTWKLIEKTFENEDKLFWIYNATYLPLLAEISPEWFISNVQETLNEHKEYIEILFKGPNYTYLLSSLELCSRDPRLFNEVVDILIELNKIEYDNRLHNSPFNSLKELFIPWRDYNSDFLQIRLNKLDKILVEDKEMGWRLLEFLLSRESKSSLGIRKPIYRDFTTTHKPITQNEVDKYNCIIEEKIITHLDKDVEKYCFLINQYSITPNKKYKMKIIEKLEKYNGSEDSVILWNKILDELYLMKRANIKTEKYTKIEIEKLESISKKFEPKDIIKISEWAFDDYIIRTLPGEDKNESMKHVRQEITSNIIQKRGFEGIEILIQNINLPEILGECVSEYDFDNEILELLNTNENNTKFSMAYIWHKSHDDFKWIENAFKKVESKEDEYLIKFFISIFPDEKNWELLNTCNSVVIDGYWKGCRNFSYKTKDGIKSHIINLIKYSRYLDAVKSLSYNLEKLETNFIGDTLLSVADDVSGEIKDNDFIFDKILEKLHEDNYNRKKLIKLEFKFSECYFLEAPKYPLILCDELTINADLFSCLINNMDNDDKQFAYHCIYILDRFNIVPGTNENNEIDIKVLRKWIHECEVKTNCAYNLYYYLANLFANTPEENDSWPKEEICQIIDELDNESLTNEFSVGIFNKHGYSVRSVFEGGNREIKLGEKYHNYASNIIHKYPITAKVLIGASESFYEIAKFEDYKAVNNNWRT